MKLDGLVVREARGEDYDCLVGLEQKVIDAERPYDESLKENGAYYYDIEKLISDQNARLVVGEVSGSIIATGYVQVRRSKPALNHDSHGYLGFMYVTEEYRGLGLNKVILRDLVSWGRQQGVTNFHLDVYAGNESAVRAYEKFGFRGSLLEMKLNVDS
ncbi:ribosomal protein S18 acetylase RimI-like enzyme [Natronospira proteinivora]|uniref:Ribosomal protein S18 acetylase RimI-like enzyme n=1 Tax=Natronospira proteinivora TaxID=1807133 RepID=A0ABT1G9K4_9GAMM|nr:GNAT family N-acetyltransferase [Natronospira proteinivora]MCP1727008.1 ribosomal protein S18 acetylase RimI-like enzyme [Natronospira proteinivora]